MEQEHACLKIGWLAFLTTADKTAAFLIIYGFSGKVSFLQIDPFLHTISLLLKYVHTFNSTYLIQRM